MIQVKSRFVCAIVLALVAGGCTGPSIWVPMSQSNFAFPNSNVRPLGHVVGVATRSYLAPFENPRFGDSTAFEEAVNNALRSNNGDILIDGSYAIESKVVPLLLLQSVTVTYTVDGTAGRMQIGGRDLH